MKKLLGLMVLLLATGALAQGRTFGEVVFGQISVLPSFSAGLGLRAGMENLLGPLALRGDIAVSSITITGVNITFLVLAADVLYPFTLQGSSLNPYVGLGGGLSATFAGSSSTTTFQVRGILGLEFPVAGKFSLFTEVVPSYTFSGSSSQFGLGIIVGPRLYF